MWAFIGVLSFIGFIVFMVLGIISAVKKNGTAKKKFIIGGALFVVLIIAFAADPNPSAPAEQADNVADQAATETTTNTATDDTAKDDQANNENAEAAKQEAKEPAKEQDAVQEPAKEEPEKKEETVPREYRAALTKAQLYADTMHMSKAGIYDQLTSEYGEQFPADAAQYAIDNLEVNWKENALKKAQEYAELMSMSDADIYDQLISEHGEKFTKEEAQYAIDNLE